MRKIISFVTNLFSNKNNPFAILKKLYRTIDGVYISHCERSRLEINDTSFTYGEIEFDSFAEILKLAGPKPGETFYDLGSGTGKAVFCAAMLYDWDKCIGIEFLPGLYQVSQELLKNFLKFSVVKKNFSKNAATIQFIQDDFLNVDFSNADVIFVNATTLNAVLWSDLELKLNTLKLGTRIILTTRKLNENFFQKSHENRYEMSWGECTVLVYIKR